jgi:hypothetical protein
MKMHDGLEAIYAFVVALDMVMFHVKHAPYPGLRASDWKGMEVSPWLM